jgi:hypothetical protein
MSEIDSLKLALERTTTRARWIRAWQGLWHGLLLGGALYLVALAVYKLAPVPWLVVTVGALLGVAVTVAGFLRGWLQPMTLAQAARFLDLRGGLKERLSTALEMSGKQEPDRWAQLLMTDAAAAAGTINPRALLPFRLPGFARWVVLLLALGAGVGFAPEYRTKPQIQKEQDSAVIKDVGRNLVQIAKREVAERKPALEETRKAVDEVGELGQRLQQAKLTRDDALKDLAKSSEALKQQALDLAKNPAVRRLEQAARNTGSSPNQTPESLQKQMDSLQKSLGDKANQQEAMKDLQKDIQKLKEAAKGMADKDGPAAAEAQKQMAQSMAELSRKAEAMGMNPADLQEAAESLRNANIEQFLKNLDVASKDLERMAEMAKSLAQMQQQAEKMGKDLAEQLQNGQAEAAAATLRKMIDQLKQGNLTPEQLQKIAQEASKASKAGEQYGKVGEKLKQAAGQCQGGDKQGGQQSLAQAEKELQELMNQLGDTQALMAAMDQLQKAQMCIANGQCWGQGKSSGSAKAGKGGKGGKGVGTWSESDAWAMPDSIQDLWDNSGVNRPDMAGKGQTDRDINSPEGLTPTKIKGNLNPGGPMPSITLRGVSIKGDSKVQYTEAVAAAQSDAQSALNQEQVPKAYRNSVRDYFDDLKK